MWLVAVEMQRQQYLGMLQGGTALHAAATGTVASELLQHRADIASRDHSVSQCKCCTTKSSYKAFVAFELNVSCFILQPNSTHMLVCHAWGELQSTIIEHVCIMCRAQPPCIGLHLVAA